MKKTRLGYYNAEVEKLSSEAASAITMDAGPIIAAVGDTAAFEAALKSPPRMLYILTGNPLTLPDMLQRARDCGKLCLLNMDFLDGLARDKFAVDFLHAHQAAGIVSTRFETLKAAQALNMITVHRTFAIDSAAVVATKKSLAQFRPTAVEILPAIAAPKVARRLSELYPDLTLIAGGLIETVQEIEALLALGIHSVTTSDPRLWLI